MFNKYVSLLRKSYFLSSRVGISERNINKVLIKFPNGLGLKFKAQVSRVKKVIKRFVGKFSILFGGMFSTVFVMSL